MLTLGEALREQYTGDRQSSVQALCRGVRPQCRACLLTTSQQEQTTTGRHAIVSRRARSCSSGTRARNGVTGRLEVGERHAQELSERCRLHVTMRRCQ